MGIYRKGAPKPAAPNKNARDPRARETVPGKDLGAAQYHIHSRPDYTKTVRKPIK